MGRLARHALQQLQRKKSVKLMTNDDIPAEMLVFASDRAPGRQGRDPENVNKCQQKRPGMGRNG